MYTKILVPLDGSDTAEKALPYGRFFGAAFKLPVELLGVIDVSEMTAHLAAEKARYLDTIVEAAVRSSETYLKGIAATFLGTSVQCITEKGRPDEIIVAKAAEDKGTLICMATHGRSGIYRWVLGSVAEKVLRNTTNPLLLLRATSAAKTEGQEMLKSVVVPLDGSELAESVLPAVAKLAKELQLAVVLLRVYSIPYDAYATGETYYAVNYDEIVTIMRDEAVEYLARKSEEMKRLGVPDVSCVAREGFAADEIISLARDTSNSVIAMCTHGRSGLKRWAMGSVTETVVRHSGNPVLVLRAG